MAQVVHADVVEEILIRLDVEDLIKSWHSLITSPPFINRHLNRSYNNELRSRSVSISISLQSYWFFQWLGMHHLLYKYICKVLVANPLTREVRQLKFPSSMIRSILCSGFGYDSSSDDYKIILGAEKPHNRTCFQVFSLKSNRWSVIGEVKYTFVTKIGILFNGALHWIVRDEKMKILIIAYDISKEEFKEIPRPVGEGCMFGRMFRYFTSRQGIVKECLCIYGYAYENDLWIMKKYNGKQSWELLSQHHEWKPNIVHSLSLSKDGSFLYHDVENWFFEQSSDLHYFVDAPIFVRSLVSP